ncbi:MULTISPECIES: ubiquinol-cytochrome C chaperone family protein [unclassified Sphingobium]|uniref:ubiquinol-cytochrome C chaperone family protein n=1 Tax=unclassified Sphingobium TaxID=2611147 RepID=UPI002224EA85|nr:MULTISPECIES: ubiquinol-cytochrome C chaperone family protein [unclassified Sphingobium]MCW2351656.1 cytochrome b pre-mRNA-processing protein 3 [Sphingobium sp. B12D2B]MCW2370922.1 cytochrome b pre-mRNA-processing protein 3 [Sphingobium sp. B11D3D]
MSLLSNLFSRKDDRAYLRPLYEAVVATAREPHWYMEGEVGDTLDGRFDMVALVLSLVLLRLEALEATNDSARLTELFIDDMDGQIRQIGFGDVVVGKQIGRMVGALGGRLAAYRASLQGEASLSEALVRNLYRGEAPAADALAYVEAQVRMLAATINACSRDALLAGQLRG